MRMILITVLIMFSSHVAAEEFLLFSDDNKFLGCWGCSVYDSGSICNEYGSHGNEYSSESIWNEYGMYGSEYSNESPWNEYSASGPKLVDAAGNYYGRFSINVYAGFNASGDLKRIYEAANGDRDVVRNLICN